MILVLAVPLLPMIALSFVPDIGYRDKSTGSWATFIAHLSDPRWVSSSARGLILMWADLAYYFGHLADAPRLHVIAHERAPAGGMRRGSRTSSST